MFTTILSNENKNLNWENVRFRFLHSSVHFLLLRMRSLFPLISYFLEEPGCSLVQVRFLLVLLSKIT